MKIVRDFVMADRYLFDFKLCTSSRGFAQVDTSQDASYFGTWASPEKLKIICYAEGDIITTIADNAQEFVEEIYKLKGWNEEMGHEFHGIDALCNEKLKAQFVEMGLKDLLH